MTVLAVSLISKQIHLLLFQVRWIGSSWAPEPSLPMDSSGALSATLVLRKGSPFASPRVTCSQSVYFHKINPEELAQFWAGRGFCRELQSLPCSLHSPSCAPFSRATARSGRAWEDRDKPNAPVSEVLCQDATNPSSEQDSEAAFFSEASHLRIPDPGIIVL